MPLVNPIEPSRRREPAQVTLSTIGDVTIAAADSVRRQRPRRFSLPASILAAGAIYLVSVMVAAGLNLPAASRWLAPLFPSLCAAVLMLFWRRTAVRAQSKEQELSASQKALEHLAYEASNATNAIRANLIGNQMEPEGQYAQAHLAEIGAAVDRLCLSMQESARH